MKTALRCGCMVKYIYWTVSWSMDITTYLAIIVDYIPATFIYKNISVMFFEKKAKFFITQKYSNEICSTLPLKKHAVGSFILKEESEWNLEQKWEVEKGKWLCPVYHFYTSLYASFFQGFIFVYALLFRSSRTDRAFQEKIQRAKIT